MTVLGPLLVVVVVLSVDLWVLADARRWAELGTPVVFRLGSATIESPQAWAVACLLVCVVFVPVYVVARRS